MFPLSPFCMEEAVLGNTPSPLSISQLLCSGQGVCLPVGDCGTHLLAAPLSSLRGSETVHPLPQGRWRQFPRALETA